MKKLTCVAVCFLFAITAWAQAPNFDYPFYMQCESGRIVDGNVYDIPECGDWDDDGDTDLMVGVFFSGNIYYYENISTGIEPEFADYVVVTADGNPISVTYG